MSRRGGRRGGLSAQSPIASALGSEDELEENAADHEYQDASATPPTAENITPGMLQEILASFDTKWNERFQVLQDYREQIADLQENTANATLEDTQLPKFVQKLDEINKFCPFIITSGLDNRVVNNKVIYSSVVSKFKPGDAEKITLQDLKTPAVIWKLSKFQSTLLQFDLRFSDWSRPVLNILFSPDLFNHMVNINSSILDYEPESYPRLLESLFSGYNFRMFSLQSFNDLLDYKYSVDDTVFKVIDEIMERANLVCGISTFPVVQFKIINVLLDSIPDFNLAEIQDLSNVDELHQYLSSKNFGLAKVKSTDALLRANKSDAPPSTPSPSVFVNPYL